MKVATLVLLLFALLTAMEASGQEKQPAPRPKTLAQKLDTEVNIHFEQTPLREVIGFLSQFADVPALIDPEVYRKKSADELLVNIKAPSISVHNVLEIITLTKGLAFDIRWGSVFLSTEGRLATLPKQVPHHFPDEEAQALLARLHEKVTYAFDETPLPDVLEYVRTLKNLNIVLDDHVKARADGIQVTRSVNGLTVRDALCSLLLPSGLTWDIHQGVVFVRAHRGDEEPTWQDAATAILDETRVNLTAGHSSPQQALTELQGKCPVPLYADPGLQVELSAAIDAVDLSLRSVLGLLAKTNDLAWDLRWGGVFLTTPARRESLPASPLPPPAKGSPEWEKKLREQLAGRVTFQFDAVELPQVLDFLRTLKGLNLVVHPKARERMAAVTLTLTAKNLSMEHALAHLLLPHGFRFELTDEVILITLSN